MEFEQSVRYLDHNELFDPDTGERVRCKRCWTKVNNVPEKQQLKVVSDTEGYQLDFFDCKYCGRETYMVRHVEYNPVSGEDIFYES